MTIREHIGRSKTISAHSSVLNKLYKELEPEFRDFLDNSKDSRCLLNMLKIPEANLITPIVKYVLRYYDTEDNVFRINGLVLCITLEDVLYLTGLPIIGKPIISKNNRDPDGFRRVFGLTGEDKTPKITTLKRIAKDINLDYEKRKKAVLLLIVRFYIVPISCGHRVSPTFIRYIEDLSLVDSYAWGAALLAFLYSGIKKGLDEYEATTIDGNFWVVLGFFLLRIPLLATSLGLNLTPGELDVPILRTIVAQVRDISCNHRNDYTEQADVFISSLTYDDVEWTPYRKLREEQHMDQAINGTYLGPLLCNTYVVYHKPHLAHHQFPVLKNSDLDAWAWKPKKIKSKKNRGSMKQKLTRFFSKEIKMWKKSMTLAQSFPAREEAVVDFDDNEPLSNVLKRLSGQTMDANENAPCDLDSLKAGVVDVYDEDEPLIKIAKRISGKKRDATEIASCDLDSADRDYDDRDGGECQRKARQSVMKDHDKSKEVGLHLLYAHIKVFCKAENMYLNGKITNYFNRFNTHKVKYEDGTDEILNLEEEDWDFI